MIETNIGIVTKWFFDRMAMIWEDTGMNETNMNQFPTHPELLTQESNPTSQRSFLRDKKLLWLAGGAAVVMLGGLLGFGSKASSTRSSAGTAPINQDSFTTPSPTTYATTTIPIGGFGLTLPNWAVWQPGMLEAGEVLATIYVADDYAKDLKGQVWRATVANETDNPTRLGELIIKQLLPKGWSNTGIRVQRTPEGKFYSIKASLSGSGNSESDGVVWTDGQVIRLVSWSFVTSNVVRNRQNERNAEYSVFVSEPIGIIEILDAVRLRHRPVTREE